ncbi:MAG: sulfite exporter TauE/SafE family protein [Alphaproteobacteria bacterium]|nr:sulfite exporter TauE/SafE family protein [Alphaproteobacteria bacterium]
MSAPLGVAAGLITTVAGMGGGLLLLLSLALLNDPLTALAVSAPALLVGNAHRVWLYRRDVDRRTVLPFAIGALLGAIPGGLLATKLPSGLITGAMLIMALLALGKAMGLKVEPPARAALPYGAFTGAVTATSGGAGVLVGPFMMARGLTGTAYVASNAAVACTMHLGRLTAYGLGGVADGGTIAHGLVLAAAIATGNLLGDAARRRLGGQRQSWLQRAVMVGCVGLALVSAAS